MDISASTIGKILGWIGSGVRKLRRWLLYRRAVVHFLSPEQYFAGLLDSSASINHTLPCIGRNEELDSVLEAIDSRSFQAITISAPPGAGKSRFLLELSRLLRGETRGLLWYLARMSSGGIWKVHFARKGSTRRLDEIPKLRKGRLVIVFDDAAEQKQQIAELLDYASQTSSEGQITVVCAIRNSQTRNIQSAYLSLAPGTIFREELHKLTKDEISAFIDCVLPQIHPQTKSGILSFTQDSVFLAVLVCQTLKSNEELINHLADPNFIFRVCIQPMQEAVSALGHSEQVSLNVLAAIAALSPFNSADTEIIERVSALTESTPEDISRLIDAAETAGLFERFASTLLRPAPELFGTLLIEQACFGSDGRVNAFANALISAFLPDHGKEVVRNVANAGWSRGVSLELVRTYVRGLRNAIGNRSSADEMQCIELVGEFASVDPIEVTDYLEVLVNYYCSQIAPRPELRDEWKYVFSDVNPLLVFCGSFANTQHKALELTRILYEEEAISTGYSNRTAEDTLEKIARFAPLKSVDLNRSALDQIKGWPACGSKGTLAALVASRGLLKYTMDWDESDDFTFRMTSQLLPASEPIQEIRRDAIEFVSDPNIVISDRTTSALALDVLGSVGEIRGGFAPDSNSETRKMLQREELQVLSALDRIREAQLTPVCSVSIEDLLWRKWAWGSQVVAEEAERMLARCDNSSISRLQRFLLSGEVPAAGGELLREYQEGSETRLNCFISEKRDQRETSRDLIDSFIDGIGFTDEPNNWISLLEETSEDTAEFSWRAWQFFEALGRRFPTSAWRIVDENSAAPWCQYRTQLLRSLRSSSTDEWFQRLTNLDTTSDDYTLIQWLYAADTEMIDERERSFIEAMAATTSEKLGSAVVGFLAHSRMADWLFVSNLLLSLCRNFPTTKNLDETLSHLVHERPDELKSALSPVDEQALDLLLSPNRPRNVPWHDPYWAGPYLKFVATVDANRFMEFLSQSASSMEQSDRYSLQVLGLRNADHALSAALDSADKETIIDQLIAMSQSDHVITSQIGIGALATGFELTNASLQVRLSNLIDILDYSSAAKILSGFPITEDWLDCVRDLTAACARNSDGLPAIKDILLPTFYMGVRHRSPGSASPRDSLVVRKTDEFLQDGSLPAAARSYFEELKREAENSIQHDLDSDERLIGRRL